MNNSLCNKFLISIFLLALVLITQAQETNIARSIPFIYGTFSMNVPGADFADRYGLCSDIGAGLGYKFANNFELSVEGTFIFSENVKDDPLMGISNEDGQITNRYGESAVIYLRLHGYYGRASLAKIIPIANSNKNSGIYLRASLGMLQHKIFIDNTGNNVPQILGDYSQGYDRLCNGYAFSEFIGWKHFSPEKYFHFFGGIEFTQAFTQNRRAWDFATNQKIEDPRTDLLYSLRFGVMILLKSRPASEYYYF